MSSNILLRRQARAAGVPLWRIAKALGIGEATMTRKLRTELSDNDKEKILDIIASLANTEDTGDNHAAM